MKQVIFIAFLFIASIPQSCLFAQDDLLSLLGEEEEVNYTNASFKTTRVVNGHSIENVAKGVLDIKISHRFGAVNGGAYELFGLDNATIRIGGDYGITDRLMIGAGRNSYEKTYDGFLKYKILRQSTGAKKMPLSASWVSTMAIKTLKFQDETRENFVTSKMYFTHQLLLASKISENFTLQLMPTLVHRNLVESTAYENDVYTMGVAFRQKLTNRVTINAEYYYVLPNQINERFNDSFSIGFDIETGGHVFQLHFTNATSMVYKGFITETAGDWLDGDIHFGFNISRVFTVQKPKGFE